MILDCMYFINIRIMLSWMESGETVKVQKGISYEEKWGA